MAKFTRRSVKSDGRSACNSQEDRVCWISPRKATTDPRALPTCRATLDIGSSSPPPFSSVSASNQSASGVSKGFPRFSQRLYASERICSSEGFGWSMQPFYRVNGAQYCAFRSARCSGMPPETGKRSVSSLAEGDPQDTDETESDVDENDPNTLLVVVKYVDMPKPLGPARGSRTCHSNS